MPRDTNAVLAKMEAQEASVSKHGSEKADAAVQNAMTAAVRHANMDADDQAFLSPKTFNWDGSEQGVEVTPLDTDQELGEAQMDGDAKKTLDHKIIQMYEQHRWGWPIKESPEMQVPGSWSNVDGLDDQLAEANEEHAMPPGEDTGYKAAMAKRKAARTVVSMPGKAPLHVQEVTEDNMSIHGNKKGSVDQYETMSTKALEKIVDEQHRQEASETPVKRHAQKAAAKLPKMKEVRERRNHDDEIFNMDAPSYKHHKGIYKQELLNDNIPPSEKKKKVAKSKLSNAQRVINKREAAVGAAQVRWNNEAAEAVEATAAKKAHDAKVAEQKTENKIMTPGEASAALNKLMRDRAMQGKTDMSPDRHPDPTGR